MAMKLRTIEYFIKEACVSLKRNGFMSIASVTTVALSLLILGLFLVLVLNLSHMATNLESQVQISVYLEDTLKEKDIQEVGMQIKKVPGVTEINYVSKAEAMEKFKKRLGEQQSLLSALGDVNPLPNSYEVKVDTPDKVKAAATSIAKIKGIENAKFGQDVVEQLFNLTKMIRIVGFVLIIFLALAATFIISNTIRITVFARRKEIGIMKYVGATDSFIRWPFLIEGMMLGFIGAIISVFILNETYGAVTREIHETLTFLPVIGAYPFMFYITIFLLIVGTIIGALGSTISLKRFMKV